ncbi:MBL fold metallo-hydrolase [Caldimonas thermodepolymerans]|uniref:MBL fold metallo-hydrolase n=1 Tax=Caldimonas thermodepolymerans TaxID=215580 RepID=A0A2S5T1T3_9BURK|nr:MBL fold metallo-hydrolase [Caldimonas thermodepolymerans]RDI03012.1 phosphoribosyl 1,2-cyclic phosphodiesterase [Caldimonas thermodepolymerans]
MIRFCSLGSGSTGNATLIEASSGTGPATRLLVDCGFSLRELEARLARAGVAATELSGVFITHEHGDHVGCALTLTRRHRVPLYTSRGTWQAIGAPEEAGLPVHFVHDGLPVDLGELAITPYTVPHDAREPLQLTCTDGDAKLGLLTDAGCATAHLLAQLQACTALLLECNHDLQMLQASRYPASLKARIAGRLGHLSNDTAAQILAACGHDGLRHVVAAHLSEQNNTPAQAARALATALDCAADEIVVAGPLDGFSWLRA